MRHSLRELTEYKGRSEIVPFQNSEPQPYRMQ